MAGQLNLRTVQLGDSADASKNFLISTPAVPDGTLTIERADGTDVLTVNASGVVVGNCGLGAGQTWQNVIGSRALGTTYTNTSGRPITVMVSGDGNVGTSSARLTPTVGGVVLSTAVTYAPVANVGYTATTIFVVPNGASYVVNQVQATLVLWTELR